MNRQITCLWKEPQVTKEYHAAVSLHGHTIHSQESLAFIPEHASENWILRWLLSLKEREALQKSNIIVDFHRAHWTPFMMPSAAYEVESGQITEQLGLRAMVSLTDHDNIQAALQLRVHKDESEVPISVEWTVPYQDSELHLGVHNLPPAGAESIVAAMNEYTDHPRERVLKTMLAELDRTKEVLVVLNHPMWDLCRLGEQEHLNVVRTFMAKLGQYVHALELGGLRSWEENRRAYEIAMQINQPVIGGGDRHGCEPSGVVNLTNATSFAEFVQEVRERRAHVLFMPQYAKPLWSRVLQTVLDVTQHQPDHVLGPYWDDRTFHPDHMGVMRPLSELWKRRPPFIEAVFSVFRLLENDAVRQAVAAPQRQMDFLLSREEA